MRIHVAQAITAVLLSSTAALAADLPPVAVEPAVIEAFDWTGFSIGVHGGAAGGDFNYPVDAPSIASGGDIEISSGGVFGGANIGADFQFGSFVLGALADISFGNIEGTIAADGTLFGTPGSVEIGSELEWFATVRGRLGYAWDRVLVYGTGGVAFGEVNSFISGLGSVKTDHVGWTAGAGLEYAVTNNFSLGTEYLYVDLSDEEVLTDGTNTLDVETEFHTVKAVAKYRF